MKKIKHESLYDNFMKKKEKARVEAKKEADKLKLPAPEDKEYIIMYNSFIPQAKVYADKISGDRPKTIPGKSLLHHGVFNAEHNDWMSLWNLSFHNELERLVREKSQGEKGTQNV